MCGRYTRYHTTEEVIDRFTVEELRSQLEISFNVAPSQQVSVVTERDGGRILDSFKWGLVPFWADDPKISYKMINARAESVAAKPAYKNALRKRRCIIPADGFYEWQREGKLKIPLHFHLKDKSLFGFAGLWETWRKDKESELLHSCTIITTAANDVVKPVHDRMPVILRPEFEEAWLDPALNDADELVQMLKPFNAEAMEAVQVSTRVNKPDFNSPECLDPENST